MYPIQPSSPKGHTAKGISDRMVRFVLRHKKTKDYERFERQYRHEPPPAFALLKLRSPSSKSLLKPHFRDQGIYTYTWTYT